MQAQAQGHRWGQAASCQQPLLSVICCSLDRAHESLSWALRQHRGLQPVMMGACFWLHTAGQQPGECTAHAPHEGLWAGGPPGPCYRDAAHVETALARCQRLEDQGCCKRPELLQHSEEAVDGMRGQPHQHLAKAMAQALAPAVPRTLRGTSAKSTPTHIHKPTLHRHRRLDPRGSIVIKAAQGEPQTGSRKGPGAGVTVAAPWSAAVIGEPQAGSRKGLGCRV